MIDAKKLFPKKYLSQNFLVDPHTALRIIQACQLTKENIVLEIGPGQGALTRELAKQTGQVYAVEKDENLCALLRTQLPANVKLLNEDILNLDFATLPDGLIVIGNLPYNISTPIIEKLIENRQQIKKSFITVQWEFGQRLAARPGKKDYGALTCFVQYHADVKILFKIGRACFRPSPKVFSCFAEIHFREPTLKANDEAFFSKIVRAAFSQRRKMISNTLKTVIHPQDLAKILTELRLPGHARAENITVEDYVKISNKVKRVKGKND